MNQFASLHPLKKKYGIFGVIEYTLIFSQNCPTFPAKVEKIYLAFKDSWIFCLFFFCGAISLWTDLQLNGCDEKSEESHEGWHHCEAWRLQRVQGLDFFITDDFKDKKRWGISNPRKEVSIIYIQL